MSIRKVCTNGPRADHGTSRATVDVTCGSGIPQVIDPSVYLTSVCRE